MANGNVHKKLETPGGDNTTRSVKNHSDLLINLSHVTFQLVI